MINLLFNKDDRKLLALFQQGDNEDAHLFNYHLHPSGIKELVNPKGLRVANLMRNLLDTLEKGKMEERLKALHALRDEVFFSTEGGMKKNTARVLLSVMKDLIREKDNEERQMELSHDFHSIIMGKPVVLRKYLKKYHLLEMPEAWNQITFDYHVHDAHTKGRKSPSHLIMDAWIKGIRKLKVIYYEYIPEDATKELLTAAGYMQIEIRIGVEFITKFRDRTASLIWTPRGFTDEENFIKFLERKNVKEFTEQAMQTLDYREKTVLAAFQDFNEHQRPLLNEEYDLDLQTLDEKDLHVFVGTGQLSLLHIAEFVHFSLMPLLSGKINKLREEYKISSTERRVELQKEADALNRLTSEKIFEEYLRGNKVILRAEEEFIQNTSIPSPSTLLDNLTELHHGYRVTLNLTGLSPEDVFEIIYLCQGKITHLEIFNQKDFAKGLDKNIPEIRNFQHALNNGNTIKIKRIIFSMIEKMEKDETTDHTERIQCFKGYLLHVQDLLTWYRSRLLKDQWGSDSTGRSTQLFGMGFAVVDTLPKKAQKQINSWDPSWIMPFHIDLTLKKDYRTSAFLKATDRFFTFFTHHRLVSHYTVETRREWVPKEWSRDKENENNVVTLGGRSSLIGNGFTLEEPLNEKRSLSYRWKYTNTFLKNFLKIFFGFVPAFLTFALTKDWWVLAYLGAPIWFGITGLRNILQSVLGGDSFRRSPLLHWKSYINWSRVSDSLLFTGFSVPLLDFLVKHLILDVSFGINTSSNVLALYTFMALTNGVYISTHNLFRGLPAAAVLGNFFRSILSIPLALLFNWAIESLLCVLGVVGINLILQKWAAVISKAASDTIAGLIEGYADRRRNIHLRTLDYEKKFKQIYSSYAKLELLLPDEDVMALMKEPKEVIKMIKAQDSDLLKTSICDTLDFLYFWMYQPHARTVFKRIIKKMPQDERIIFLNFQYLLKDRKMISQFFVSGLVGDNFERALAFYLTRSEDYLNAVEKLIKE